MAYAPTKKTTRPMMENLKRLVKPSDGKSASWLLIRLKCVPGQKS
jgi:hypothetical protein